MADVILTTWGPRPIRKCRRCGDLWSYVVPGKQPSTFFCEENKMGIIHHPAIENDCEYPVYGSSDDIQLVHIE